MTSIFITLLWFLTSFRVNYLPLVLFACLPLLCLECSFSVPPLQYQYDWLPHLANVCSSISLFSLFWPPYLKLPLPFPSAFSLPLLCFSLISSHDFKIYSFIMFVCCLFYLLKWKLYKGRDFHHFCSLVCHKCRLEPDENGELQNLREEGF